MPIQTIKLTLNPNWAPFEISGEDLNNGDPKRPLLIQIWDWNRKCAPSALPLPSCLCALNRFDLTERAECVVCVVHSGAHSFIGQVETDTEELYTNKGDFPVINNMKKAKKKKYRDSGAPPPPSRDVCRAFI